MIPAETVQSEPRTPPCRSSEEGHGLPQRYPETGSYGNQGSLTGLCKGYDSGDEPDKGYFPDSQTTRGEDGQESYSHCGGKEEDARLLLAGPWFKTADRECIEGAYNSSPVKGSIELLGPVYGQEKLDVFARADVFAMPTCYPSEGQPMAILEAMASGLPVVACDRGVITDMVVDGVGGFIVPPGSPKEIAERILDLFGDPTLAREQGRFNASRAEEHFSLERYIDKVELDLRTAAAQ